jgi:hypothetical protein
MVAKQNCHNRDLDFIFDIDGSLILMSVSTLYFLHTLIRYSLSCLFCIEQITCQTPWALYGQASRAISIG